MSVTAPRRGLRPLTTGDRLTLGAFLAALVVLALTVLAAEVTGRDIAFFTREPSAALLVDTCSGASCSYVGAVSNLEAIVWAAGLTACCLGAALASRVRERWLLAGAGAVTALLLADDMFQLHEWVWPVGERYVWVVYGTLVGAFAVAFRRELLAQPRPLLLPLAGGLFFVSAVADLRHVGGHLIEDGSKLVGVVAWTAFVVGAAVTAIRSARER